MYRYFRKMKPENNLYTKKIRYCISFSQFKYLIEIKLEYDILNYYMKKKKRNLERKSDSYNLD